MVFTAVSKACFGKKMKREARLSFLTEKGGEDILPRNFPDPRPRDPVNFDQSFIYSEYT